MFLLLFAFPPLFLTLNLCFITSPATPFRSLEDFQTRLSGNLPSGAAYLRTIRLVSRLQMDCEWVAGCDLVLEAAVEGYWLSSLALLCEEKSLTGISLSGKSEQESSDYENIYADLESTLRYFNWTSVSLLYGPDSFGQLLSARLKVKYTVTEELISENERYGNIQKAISRGIKQFGSNVIVLAASLEGTKLALSVLKSENMFRAGYAIVVVGEGVWESEAWPGLLLVKEEDCVSAQSRWHCDADKVAAFIYRVSHTLNISPADLRREDFANYLAAAGQTLITSFVLVNIYSDRSQIVGRFNTTNNEMSLSGTVNYPGNVADLPAISQGVLTISFNSGFENPSIAPTAAAAAFYTGQRLAVMQVNQRSDLLPQHTLVCNEVAFGASQWSASWAIPRIFANKDKLGLAYMAGYGSVVTKNTLLSFSQLGLSLPVVGSSNSLAELGNSTLFPWFLRNGISDLYRAGLYSNVLPELGWQSCAVLYGDDLYGESVYAVFKELAKFRNIEILNNETMRKIPGLAQKQIYWKDYKSHLLELFRCNARVIIMILLQPTPQYLLELLFDLGARKGDFIITGAWLSASDVTVGSATDLMKRRELLEGTVGTSATAYLGPIGAQVKADIARLFNDTNPPPFACLYYDSVFALAHAIDRCIHLGLDYSKPSQLMKILRETRFKGCSGFVSWESGNNNRASMDYMITNLVKDPASGAYSLKEVGRYSPTSTLLFNFTAPFTFADGTSRIPSALRVVFGDCPFEDKLMREFPKGQSLAIGICAVLVTFTTLFTVIIYTKVWRVKMNPMRRVEISIEDVVFLSAIGVEAVQLATIGPDLKSLSSALIDLAKLFTVDLSNVVTFKNGVYWISLNSAFGVVAAWVLFNIFSCFRLGERLKQYCLVRLIEQIAYYCLPLLGTVCFVPIVFVLLDVFICDHAVGYGTLGFAESVLARDCYVNCWNSTHSLYAAFAAIALGCYVPSAILFRPIWTDYQDYLHIKTYPLYLLVKSVVQVILICLSKTLKRWYPLANSILFLCIMTAYICFLSMKRAYNYSRANLWQCLSLVGVLQLALLALLNDTIYHNPNFKLVILLAILWLLLIGSLHIVLGAVLQCLYLPSMLYKRPGRDFSSLLSFAFTSRVPASAIQPQLNLARCTTTGPETQERGDLEGRMCRRIPIAPLAISPA